MRKYLLILALGLWTSVATAAEIDQAGLKELENSIGRCSEFMDPNEDLPPEDYYRRIEFAENVQQCYINLGVKIFERYYRKKPESAEADLKQMRDLLRKRFTEVTAHSIYCKPRCGVQEYLVAEQNVTYALENYLRQTVKFLQTRQ